VAIVASNQANCGRSPGFANRIQAFCDSGDTFCDRGLNVAVHSTYLNRHQNDAAAFVLDKTGG
jgi:acetylxylan esterase